MKSSAQKFLEKIEVYYANIYNLLNAYKQAQDSNNLNEQITVILKDPDTNESKTVVINSFAKLQQELTRLDNNFKALINADGYSYILNNDGSLSQYTRTTFMNAQIINNFEVNSDDIKVDQKSTIDNLMYPIVKLPISIDKNIISNSIFCRTFEITYGFENLQELASYPNPKQLDLEYLFNTGKLQYRELTRELEIEKTQIQYFGKFNIESVELVKGSTDNQYICVLDTINYTALNVIGNSIRLKTGDLLCQDNGTTKYSVSNIDIFTNTVTLTRVAGVDSPKVGIEQLYYNEVVVHDDKIVQIPIKPNQKLVVFLSTINDLNISYPTPGIIIDTEDFKVSYKDDTYTIDEFFSKFVTNFSEYLLHLMQEVTIPYSLGVKPAKPEITYDNFKVVQINTHVTDAKTQQIINSLNKQKQSIQNDINLKTQQIQNQENELNSKKFNSVEEKEYIIKSISSKRNDLIVLKQNLLNVTREIDTNAINFGVKNQTPKYRILGIWEIQDNIYSPTTGKQNIIKYDIEYRYLSPNLDTTEATSFKTIQNGQEKTVTFSSWNRLESKTRNKVMNLAGSLVWEEITNDNINEIGINQLSIPINSSESVEIRIRAISEAGYPVSPLKSEYSNIIRINFPESLTQNNVYNVVEQNEIDLQNAEFINILNTENLLEHVADRIVEAEKTFQHQARNITSGQYTPEQKNIPLDVCLTGILNRISTLENLGKVENVTISFIDFNNEQYTVLNGSTIESFAGNYSDTFDILDKTNWGGIIRKKGYIKIKNTNVAPIELKTKIPGNLPFDQQEDYIDVPVKFNIIGQNSQDTFSQTNRQIVYFRNKDLNGFGQMESKLIENTEGAEINTNILPQFQHTGVNDAQKNIVYRNGNKIEICKLNESDYNDKIAVFTTEHPDYISGGSKYTDLNTKFDNQKTHWYIHSQQLQLGNRKAPLGLGFDEHDRFGVGYYTCGAYLYPALQSVNSIQVQGNSTESTLVIPGETELLIPVIFEYRMIDRLGKIDGLKTFDLTTQLEYTKKIGIDMLLNNQEFRFDVNVRARLRSRISAQDTANLGTVINSYRDNESPEILN